MNPEAFYSLSYGIYVIGATNEEMFHGYIANTAFQVISEPPQIAISCHKNNISALTIRQSGFFSLSVLCYGYYSNVSRGKRKKRDSDELMPSILEPDASSKDNKRDWARLLQKIYEVDPLTCPKCFGKMK